jgi:hypothetical protein
MCGAGGNSRSSFVCCDNICLMYSGVAAAAACLLLLPKNEKLLVYSAVLCRAFRLNR